jgi:hypothetical protein
MSRRSVIFGASTAALVAVLTAGCNNETPNEPDCTAALSSTSSSVGASGGAGSITVTTDTSCTWSAQSNASWLSLSSTSGSGTATLTFTAAENTSESARTGTLTIAGLTFTVTQAGRTAPPTCTFAVTPESALFGKDGGAGNVTVTAPAGCEWTAASSAPWVVIVTGNAGTGNGSVAYSIAENNSTAERTTTLLVAGRNVVIMQAGESVVCEYSVAPVQLTTCMGATVLTTTVTTASGCTWTAQPNASWMNVAVQSGTGPASIQIAVSDNYDLPRDGLLLVRWPSPTQGQNVRVAQAGCRYAVTQSVFVAPVGGLTANFMVLQQSDPTECGGALQDRCVWSAVADVPWIAINGTMPRAGDDLVSFTVLANPDGPRSGTIRVRDQTVRIDQTGHLQVR